jgi:hypothetical protein
MIVAMLTGIAAKSAYKLLAVLVSVVNSLTLLIFVLD